MVRQVKEKKIRKSRILMRLFRNVPRTLATIYSPLSSTIDSRRLNCRVRNENGCGPSDKSPAFWVRLRSQKTNMQIKGIENELKLHWTTYCAIQNSAQKTGHISTPRLNTLLCLHLEPINLVIFKVSHNDF